MKIRDKIKNLKTEQIWKVQQGLLSLVISFGVSHLAHAVPAFPGAQGGGAASAGGRGGRIIEVTSLADSGTGTLRACVTASGPRICVFRIGGEIRLSSGLYITNPYLTVAGQTAPGGGIQITGPNMADHLIMFATHDVVWQYTKIRKGYNSSNTTEFANGANMTMWPGSYNMVIDHNSVQWNQDEGISVWSGSAGAVKNVTLSFNLIAEGLKQHSTGMIIGGEGSSAALTTDIDIHHNLTMNNSHRNPLLTNKSSRLINNIVYNYAYYATQIGGGVMLDAIGNKYKRGPLNANAPLVHEIQMYSTPSLYIAGNVGYFQPNPAGEQWLLVSQVPGQNGYDSGTAAPTSSRRSTRLPDTQYPITVESVTNLDNSIVPTVGASRRLNCDGTWIANRDSADSRMINQYNTNTGISSIPVSQNDVGGFPVLAAGTPCADADHDGMPDVWESARGLNPNNAADASSDRNGDGFTNIEEFLAGNSGGTTSPPPTTTLPAPPPTTTTTTIPVASGWTFCANEGGLCSFSGTRTVRYGSGSTYVTRVATGSIACDNNTFGDPIAGVVKHCDYSAATSTTTTTTTTIPASSGISNFVISNDASNVSFSYNFSGSPAYLRVYLDSDRSASTGYSIGGIGANYLIENGDVFQYTGSNGSWSWARSTSSNMVKPSTNAVKFTVARSAIGFPSALSAIANTSANVSSGVLSYTLTVTTTTTTTTTLPPSSGLSISSLSASSTSTNVTYRYSFTGTPTFHRLFLDTDGQVGTGLSRNGIGADYMVEGATLYRYSGSSGSWTWTVVRALSPAATSTSMQWSILRSDLKLPRSIKVFGEIQNSTQTLPGGVLTQALP